MDLKEGFISLDPKNTKMNNGWLVPLNGELLGMFRAMPKGLTEVRVGGKAFGSSFQWPFENSRKRSRIEDFTFRYLRHTAINNCRLKSQDYLRIMAANGHKTVNVFMRYSTMSKQELRGWVGEYQ